MCSFTQKKERGIHHQRDEKRKESSAPMAKEGCRRRRGCAAPGPRPDFPGRPARGGSPRAPGGVLQKTQLNKTKNPSQQQQQQQQQQQTRTLV